ncbi:MAG: TMEM165/GDT1 family protein [Actinobacteria bacterium]|nr:TMEM165/GDT1 family protein [Actinomycetota bacterium]
MSALLLSFAVIFVADLGDKTMLATIRLASTEGWFGTWLGSTLGMVAADALAIAVGTVLGRTLPDKVVRYGAGTLFLLFAAVLILEGILAAQ